MPSILQRGATVLRTKQESYNSETVRVIRGATVLCDAWAATVGRNPIEIGLEGELSVLGSRHDWIGNPADWKYEGATTKPSRGDLIQWTRGEYELTFELLPADGENVWSPAGSFGDRIRVHTKLIERKLTQ